LGSRQQSNWPLNLAVGRPIQQGAIGRWLAELIAPMGLRHPPIGPFGRRDPAKVEPPDRRSEGRILSGNQWPRSRLCHGITRPEPTGARAVTLLKWALIFFVVSVIAGVLGFTGISAASADVARILFYIFVVIFLVLLVLGLTIFRV
jgi:uncharacterized membrane protein YtjA (UPF0391 family)